MRETWLMCDESEESTEQGDGKGVGRGESEIETGMRLTAPETR